MWEYSSELDGHLWFSLGEDEQVASEDKHEDLKDGL
jgi:hypothetical protein